MSDTLPIITDWATHPKIETETLAADVRATARRLIELVQILDDRNIRVTLRLNGTQLALRNLTQEFQGTESITVQIKETTTKEY